MTKQVSHILHFGYNYWMRGTQVIPLKPIGFSPLEFRVWDIETDDPWRLVA